MLRGARRILPQSIKSKYGRAHFFRSPQRLFPQEAARLRQLESDGENNALLKKIYIRHATCAYLKPSEPPLPRLNSDRRESR